MRDRSRVFICASLLASACRGTPGAQGAPGVDGVSGYELIKIEATADPHTGRHLHLRCPAGKKVISAGWFGNDNDVGVVSYPREDGTWSVWFTNGSTLERQVSAYGICVIAR